MCGLSGVWFRKAETAASFSNHSRWCKYALSVMRHRGPEGKKCVQGENFILCHSLLAFRKTYGDEQPLHAHGSIAAFNGEIYNMEEIKDTLGLHARAVSEIDVVCRAYARFGRSFPRRLKGMYAIALVDGSDGALHLFRDPLGKKPLYYLEQDNAVYFASELSPLLDAARSRTLSPIAVRDYLLFNSLPPDRCILAEAGKVPPGASVRWNGAARNTERFWRPTPQEDRSPDRRACAEELERVLVTAVRRRLQSDTAEPGLLVSGGLDSALVASIARDQHRDRKWRAYSGRFVGASYDETPAAALLARATGLEHVPIDLTDDVLAAAAMKYCAAVDEPIADPSFVAMGAILERARERSKYLLTGDGADDLFFGYSFFRIARVLEALHRLTPQALAGWAAHALTGLPGRDANMNAGLVLGMLARGVAAPPAWRFAYCTSAFSPNEMTHCLTPAFAGAHDAVPPFLDEASSSLRRAQAGMFYGFLQASILTKLDRASMLNSMELRSPFLDIDVVEASFRYPAHEQIRGGETKQIVRSIAEKWLPGEIVHRKKQGFRLPVRRLSRTVLATEIRKYLSPDVTRAVGVFAPDAVERISAEHFDKGLDHSKKIWTTYCLQKWAAHKLHSFS